MIASLYEMIAGRPCFMRVNTFLYRLALKGMGVWNSGMAERWFIEHYIGRTESPVIFDVGAHDGSYSRMVLKANPCALVYSFEPHPDTFARLIVGCERSGYYPHNAAVGDHEGTATLYDYAGGKGSEHASTAAGVIEGIHHGKSVAHEVKLTTIDAFCAAVGIERIHFLKIDVEGTEMAVLRGAERMIKSGNVEVIQFEFNEMNVVSRTFMSDFMKALLPDYRLFRLLPRGMYPLDAMRVTEREVFGAQNIVAIKEERT